MQVKPDVIIQYSQIHLDTTFEGSLGLKLKKLVLKKVFLNVSIVPSMKGP